MKPKHGGKRANAGRKNIHWESSRKIPTSVRLTPTLLAYLREGEGSVALQVEAIVRRSAGFKAWVKG